MSKEAVTAGDGFLLPQVSQFSCGSHRNTG
jgi:hypothetical protein